MNEQTNKQTNELIGELSEVIKELIIRGFTLKGIIKHIRELFK